MLHVRAHPFPTLRSSELVADGAGGGRAAVRHSSKRVWTGRATAGPVGVAAASDGSRQHRRLSAAATGDGRAGAERGAGRAVPRGAARVLAAAPGLAAASRGT